MKKVMLYPIGLRLWHWFNAIVFFVLIISGVSMQYSDTSSLLMPFQYAIVAHNICGVLLSIIFLIYLIYNIKTQNYLQYLPQIRGMREQYKAQLRYYIYGVFKDEPHPFHPTPEAKFNPLQKITYFAVMFLGLPAIILSGWLLMFPELAPEQIMGMGGVWPMALLHITVGFFLNLFFIGHIYLATHGRTVGEHFKSMITGMHLHTEHEDHSSEVPDITNNEAIDESDEIDENADKSTNNDEIKE